VDTKAHGAPAPMTRFSILGRNLSVDSSDFADAVANAHIALHRPRCLCRPEGVEMYVAKLGDGHIVKRMPDTGHEHALSCPSYAPAADESGLGQMLGNALTEDPTTGMTTLKLDFPLVKRPGHHGEPPQVGEADGAATDGRRLTLRGLLHYLWEQAGLTRWQPAFAGRRSWGTVRRHLLHAAAHMQTRDRALPAHLYIPQPFTVEQRDELNARRLAQWGEAIAVPGKPQRLMVLIGEVKEISPARFGHKAVVKHLPDQAFALDETLYARLARRFEAELSMWASAEGLRMVTIASFCVNQKGIAAIQELSLMPVTAQWLPVEDAFELRLVEHLVLQDREFIKGMRYGLSRKLRIASAVLTADRSSSCRSAKQSLARRLS
jgi:hypothetical protein